MSHRAIADCIASPRLIVGALPVEQMDVLPLGRREVARLQTWANTVDDLLIGQRQDAGLRECSP